MVLNSSSSSCGVPLIARSVHAVFGIALAAFVADRASAVVRGDLHWRCEDSPVVLDASLVVESDGSLIIDPGVIVRLPEGAVLRVQGRLHVMGSPQHPVRFLPLEDHASWGGLVIDGGDVLVSQATVEDAGVGIDAAGGAIVLDRVQVLRSATDGVRVGAQARLRLFDCLVQGSGGAGLALRGASVEAQGCRLVENPIGASIDGGSRLQAEGLRVTAANTGLNIEEGGQASLRRSEIGRCDAHGIRVQAGGLLDVAETAIHDNAIGLEFADPAGQAIGRDSGTGLNVFGCNALDVVSSGSGTLDASGNYWGGGPAIWVQGDVSSVPHLEQMPGAAADMERLTVAKNGGGVGFSWESVADCASHEVLASSDAREGFVPAHAALVGTDSTPALVFFQLRTQAWGALAD